MSIAQLGASMLLRRSLVFCILLLVTIFDFSVAQTSSYACIDTDTFRLEADAGSPELRLFGRWPSGTIYRQEYLALNLASFEEIDSSDIVRRTKYFDSPDTPISLAKKQGPVAGTNATKVYFEEQIGLYGNATVVMEAGIVDKPYNVILAGATIPVRPNSVKFSVTARNIPFLPSTVRFRLNLRFGFFAPPTTLGMSHAFINGGTLYVVNVTTTNIFTTIALQQFAALDGILRGYTNQEPTFFLSENATYMTIGFEFIKFNNEFIYDPDFSMLLLLPDPGPEKQPAAPSSSQQLNSNAAGDFAAWILAPIVLSVFILAGATAFVIWFRRNQRFRRESADFQRVAAKALSESHTSTPSGSSPAGGSPPLSESRRWTLAKKPSAVLAVDQSA